jgi:26S proteasome regulatory subunit T1
MYRTVFKKKNNTFKKGRTHILKIHAKVMSVDRDIRFELLARLCPNTTGAELRSVCTEAGMYAIRARRKSVSEKDFLDSINKVFLLLFIFIYYFFVF